MLKYRWLIMLMVGSLAILLVACGGGDDDESSDMDDPVGSNSSGGSNNGGSGSGDNPFTFPGLGGDGDADCSSITDAFGIPGAALGVGASDSPTSDFGMQVSDFITGVIEAALSTDADVTCYWELTAEDEGAGVFIAFSVDDAPGPDAADLLADELVDQGVSVDDATAFSGNFGQGQFSAVGFESIPGVDGDSGGLLLVSGSSIVATLGSDFNSDDDPDDNPFGGSSGSGGSGGSGGGDTPSLDDLIATSIAEGGGGGSASGSGSSSGSETGPGGGGAPTPTPTAVVTFGGSSTLSGIAGQVSNALEEALEEALGVALQDNGGFSTTSAGTTTFLGAYTYTDEIEVDIPEALSDVVMQFGGTVDFSFNASDVSSVTFSSATIAGATVGGSFAAAEEIGVTLQIME